MCNNKLIDINTNGCIYRTIQYYAAEKSYVIKSAVSPEVSDKLLQQSGVTYIQAVSVCVCVCHSGSVKASHSAMKVLWVAMMN